MLRRILRPLRRLLNLLLPIAVILLILFPGMPQWGADALIMCCIAFMMYSFASYALFYRKLLRTGK